MSVEISDNTKKLKYEKIFIKFLTDRLAKYSIKLQHITGYMSQVPPEVRKVVGTSEPKFLTFLEKHKDIFKIENGVVSLVNYSLKNKHLDSNVDGSLADEIINGTGKIMELEQTRGTINAEDPIVSTVYFSTKHFLPCFKEEVNLMDYGLKIGTVVHFNAIMSKKDQFPNEYHATKVWEKEVDVEENNITCKLGKESETVLSDSDNLKGEGVIVRLFSNFGFIAINGDKKNIVFFHISQVLSNKKIYDLLRIFWEGDLVEFIATRSEKQNVKAKWVATKVWKKSQKNIKVKKQGINTTHDSESNITINNELASLKESISASTDSVKNNERTMPENAPSEKIHDQSGKIYCSNGTVIKFGENLSQLADGISSIYYICGTEVTDISREFSDGDDVKFDAVKIKFAPGWKAVLVWKGVKPNIVLPINLTDFSEINNEIWEDICENSVSPLTSARRLSVTSFTSENSLSMKSECNYSNYARSSVKTSSMQDLHIKAGRSFEKLTSISKRPDLPSFHTKSLNNLPVIVGSDISKQTETEKSVSAVKDTTSSFHVHPKNTTQSDGDKQTSTVSDYLTEITDDKLGSRYENANFFVCKNNDKIAAVNDSHEFTESSDESEIDNYMKSSELDCKNEKEEKKASVRKFEDVIGKITKVQPTFAEVKSAHLTKPAAFFGRILYCAKKSIASQRVKDLREVLKVGDTVHFNYFEIIDDIGQIWNKVSLVWSGLKPVYFTEIAIVDFIQQNNISFTVHSELNKVQFPKKQETKKKSTVNNMEQNYISFINSNEVSPLKEQETNKKSAINDLIQQNSFSITKHNEPNNAQFLKDQKKSKIHSADMKQQNDPSIELNNVLPPKEGTKSNEPNDAKSMQQQEICKNSTFENTSLDNKVNGCMSSIKSYSDVGDDCYSNAVHSCMKFETQDKQENPTPSNIKIFLDLIRQQMLMNNDFIDSEVDLNSLAAEIVNLALERLNTTVSTNNGDSSDKLLLGNQSIDESTCSVPSSYKVETVHKYNQTGNAESVDVQATFTSQNIINIIILSVLIFLLLKHFEG